MILHYFAGSIFTFEQVFPLIIGGLALIGLTVGLVVFAGRTLVRKGANKTATKQVGLLSSIGIGFGLLAAVIVFGFVIPTRIKDSNFIKKQDKCALEAGFKNRVSVDNGSDPEAGYKQPLYFSCLDAAQ